MDALRQSFNLLARIAAPHQNGRAAGTRFISVWSVAAVCLTTALGGCQRANPTVEIRGSTESLVLAVVPLCTEDPFWASVKHGAEVCAEQRHIRLVWDGPLTAAETRAQDMIVERLLNTPVGGLAVAVQGDPRTRSPLQQAVKAGCPLILMDPTGSWNEATCSMFSGREFAGTRAAHKMLELLGGRPGRLLVLRHAVTNIKAEQRANGFAQISRQASMTVVDTTYLFDAPQLSGQELASGALAQHVRDDQLELAGIFACSPEVTFDLATALQTLRMQGVDVDSVVVIGCGDGAELIKLVASGQVQLLIAENPKRLGYLAVEMLAKAVRGESVPATVDLEPIMYVP